MHSDGPPMGDRMGQIGSSAQPNHSTRLLLLFEEQQAVLMWVGSIGLARIPPPPTVPHLQTSTHTFLPSTQCHHHPTPPHPLRRWRPT